MTEPKTYQQKPQQAPQAAIQLTTQDRTTIAVYDPETQQAIEQYKAGLKIKDATIHEYAALAMLCRAHNLDAYNQEAWIIPGNGVMVGIKGLRKATEKQLPKGAHFNPSPRFLQHSEYAKYGLDEETPPMGKLTRWNAGQKTETWEPNPIIMVYVSELTRSDATSLWIEQAKELTALTGSYEEAIKLLGPRPVWVGIGVVRKLDKSKMETVQLARKRSESDAIKQAFNLPFAIDLERGGDEMVQAGDVIDGEVVRNGNRTPAEQPQVTEVVETEVVEPEPAPVPQPEAPAAEKPAVSAQTAAPVAGGKIAVEPAPKPAPAPKPKAKPAPKKAEEKPAEPIKDNGEDIDLLALKRCKPSSWVTAAEMLNKTLKAHMTAGQLREEVDQKLGTMFTELNADAWATAIEIAQEAAKSK